MYTLRITVKDMAGDLGENGLDVEVPLDERATVDDLVARLVEFLKWAQVDSFGKEIGYAAFDGQGRDPLLGAQPVGESSLHHGGTVILGPAGSPPPI